MPIGDSIRSFRYAPQGTVDTAPATWYVGPVDGYEHEMDRGREKLDLLRNTANRMAELLRTGDLDTLKISHPLHYDWTVRMPVGLFGLPTTANHAATGVKNHDYTDVDDFEYMAFRFSDSEGWYEMLNAVASNLKIEQPNKSRPKFDWDYTGPAAYPIEVTRMTFVGGPTAGGATIQLDADADYDLPQQTTASIAFNATAAAVKAAIVALSRVGTNGVDVTRTGAGSAVDPYVYTILWRLREYDLPAFTMAHTFTGGTTPSATMASVAFETAFPLSESLADYNHPATWSHVLWQLNSADTEIKSMTLNIKREVEWIFNGHRTVAPTRPVIKNVEITGDIVPDFSALPDSYLRRFFHNGELTSLYMEWASIKDEIGTGSPTVPLMSVLLDKVKMESSDHKIQEIPTGTSIKFVVKHSPGDGRSIRLRWTNEIPSVATS